jgi:tellurite resistance protein TerC
MEVNYIWWILFNAFVFSALALDLGIFQKKSHEVGYREAIIRSIIWMTLALIFCVGIYFTRGSESALNFLAGYLLEQSLSVDNLFVFLTIFSYFAVPKQYMHRVLFWGIISAVILRAIFIFAGIILIEQFHWMIYVFGLLVIFAGFKLAAGKSEEIDIENNYILKILRKIIPVTPNYENGNFFIKKDGRLWATPLFVVLLVIETTDVMFAIDSVPAILAITTDPFIVYTSNVFAILGLRSLFFALQKMMQAFHYLHYGLAALLIFIGLKMLLSGFIHVPVLITLGVIAFILSLSVIISLKTEAPKP